jgi:hypothetical protein
MRRVWSIQQADATVANARTVVMLVLVTRGDLTTTVALVEAVAG